MTIPWARFRPLASHWQASRKSCRTLSVSCRYNNTADTTQRLRNIGIIAHIDAGKTTTTERMLYYSGFTRKIGDVDDGNTVTDFLPAERARGITIQSAAISFSWPPSNETTPAPLLAGSPRSSAPHNINLIDTPGHADFTFEVLRSLRVLDGAVCILDGVAGVEAQTEKVWSQASTHAIPRIAFVNKLDRPGAAFGRTVQEIAARLHVWPAVCAIPWWAEDGRLQGVGDVIGLRGLFYEQGGDGKRIRVASLMDLQTEHAELANELRKARIALIELLSEHDDAMVEKYLVADEDHLAIPALDVLESLRRCTLQASQRVVPVFAGASFRNIGVQPLLDAVVDLLPSPAERPDAEIKLGSDTYGGLSTFLAGDLSLPESQSNQTSKKPVRKEKTNVVLQNLEACALAFKVVADPKRGVLVYVRVYSGTIHRSAGLWNTNLHNMERAPRLLKMYANDAVEIDSIPSGQIGVIPGLKFARTGDTLVSYTRAHPKNGPPQPINSLQLRPITVPPPVFFVSVEPHSLAEQRHIAESLALLLREDPSLYVSQDEESGQTHLAGMGELHLEIARDRLVSDLKAKARIGKIEIGYREAITAPVEDITETFDRDVAGKSSKAAITCSVRPLDDTPPPLDENVTGASIPLPDNNHLTIHYPTLQPDGSALDPEAHPSLPDSLPLATLTQALRNGVSAALARGPTYTYPLHSTHVSISFDPSTHLFPSSTPAAFSSAARTSVQSALKRSVSLTPSTLMEPVMLATISVDEASLGAVVHDLSSARGGSVLSLDGDHDASTNQDTLDMRVDVERVYAPPDPFAGGHTGFDAGALHGDAAMRSVVARVPLKELVGYLKHLRSLTGGRGTFTMVVDRFERMSAPRQKAVLVELRGDYV